MKQDWLSLTEYSIKHRVSISTLRRRIKTADIQFRLEDGKYMILDNQEEIQKHQFGSAEDRFEYSKSSPSQANPSSAVSVTYNYETADQFRVENIVKGGAERRTSHPIHQQMSAAGASSGAGATAVANHMASSKMSASTASSQSSQTQMTSQSNEATESVLTAANRLLTDLKKAYTQVLQEKEQVISDLREENSDLKTLIKVLESENDRLRDSQN